MNTIQIREVPVYRDATATEVINAGDLIRFSGDGVAKHNEAGGDTIPMFALENDLEGKTVEDAYEVNDSVRIGIFRSGSVVNCRVPAGAPQLLKGVAVTSNGDGNVRAQAGNESVLGYVSDTVNNSAGTEDAFVKIIIK